MMICAQAAKSSLRPVKAARWNADGFIRSLTVTCPPGLSCSGFYVSAISDPFLLPFCALR